MKFTISPDRRSLTLTVDESERASLRRLEEDVHRNDMMRDFLQDITCNSELDWVDPSETGDLTDAPMLGIRRGDLGDPNPDHGDPGPIVERWAWMPYQVRSLLEELRDKGEAVLVGGN